jgi:hypothetical protein
VFSQAQNVQPGRGVGVVAVGVVVVAGVVVVEVVVVVVVGVVVVVVLVGVVVVVVVVDKDVSVDRRIIAVAGETVTEVVVLPLDVMYEAPSENVCEVDPLGFTTTVPPVKFLRHPTPTWTLAPLGCPMSVVHAGFHGLLVPE